MKSETLLAFLFEIVVTVLWLLSASFPEPDQAQRSHQELLIQVREFFFRILGC